jgi:ASC-1-like (ASCH) protein
MEHVAIMRKSWGLTQKILSGQKKIESRWYKVKCAPWDIIKAGETVYFKDSGEPVTIKTEVDKVLQFSDLTPDKVKEVLYQYGQAGGLGIDTTPEFFEMFKDKKYCILIFLKNPQETTPFEIDKSGFGAMSAWISVDDVNRIKAIPRLKTLRAF